MFQTMPMLGIYFFINLEHLKLVGARQSTHLRASDFLFLFFMLIGK